MIAQKKSQSLLFDGLQEHVEYLFDDGVLEGTPSDDRITWLVEQFLDNENVWQTINEMFEALNDLWEGGNDGLRDTAQNEPE